MKNFFLLRLTLRRACPALAGSKILVVERGIPHTDRGAIGKVQQGG